MEKKELNIKVEENELGHSLDDNSLSNSWELLRQLMENSHATRREIEGLSNLLQLKDNRIKDVEDKLSELEIKLSVYRERAKIQAEKIQDKDDLIAALSLDSTGIKTKLDNCIQLFTTLKDQHQIAEYEDILKKKDEQITELESKIKSYDIKLEDQKAQIKSHKLTIEKLNDTINKLEKTNRKIRIYAPYGCNEPEMHVPGIDPFVPTLNDSIAGPGWIVIQRRSETGISFDRNIASYHDGFGNFGTVGDLWLGLERLHKITSQEQHELFIQYIEYVRSATYYAHYDNFVVGSKDEDYALKSLGNYQGNTSDMMRSSINASFVVSSIFKGGWWYSSNTKPHCNLNGKTKVTFFNASTEYISWGFGYGGSDVNNIRSVQMLIRPKIGTE